MKIFLFLALLMQIGNAEFIRDNFKNVVTDTQRDLMWQDNNDVKTVTKNYKEAFGHCKNLSLGSFSDWTLPSQDTLYLLVDKNKKHPAINRAFKNVLSNAYWTSSSDKKREVYASVVHFCNGQKYKYEKKNFCLVRCVRKIKTKKD